MEGRIGFAWVGVAFSFLLLGVSAPIHASPVPCGGLCRVDVGNASIVVEASSEFLEVSSWTIEGIDHLYEEIINLFDANTGEAVDVVLVSATQDAVTGQIVIRYREEFSGAIEGTATFTLRQSGNTSILEERLTIQSSQNGVRGQLYVLTDFDVLDSPTDDSAHVTAGTLTQTEAASTATVGVIAGPAADSFQLAYCCELDDIADDIPLPLNGTDTLPGPGDFQFAQRWTRTLNSGQVFEVTLRKSVSVPSMERAEFDALGGYAAYLAEPSNSDLLAGGVCDEDAAFDHWQSIGRSAGRNFAQGVLRSDLPGGVPDPDYAIDGGFSWEYPGANTVVYITADAPKPSGWDGRNLLLERCQNFNLGDHYTAEDYRSINTDVAMAIDGGLIPGFDSVTDHYVKYGFKEGRLTNDSWTQDQYNQWSDAAYFPLNRDVESFFLGAQSEGWKPFGKIGFAHWINFGQFEGRNPGQVVTSPSIVEQLIGTSGGDVVLPNVAMVSIPPGAFDRSTEVSLKRTTSTVTADEFDEFTALFRPAGRLGYEVRINTGSVPPTSEQVEVSLELPPAFAGSVPPGHQVELFARVIQEGGEEEIPVFVLLPAEYFPISNSVVASVPTAAFSQTGPGATYETIVTLAPTPGENRGLVSTSSLLSRATEPDRCEGASIGCPISGGCEVTSSFRRARTINGVTRPHYGTDFRALIGTEVVSAADGDVERSYTSTGGYGETIIVRHDDGSATLYAHLSVRSVARNVRVTKGSRIGLSGNTGRSTGPHLHFEYVPNGEIIASKSRIDPVPCFGSTASGSITVGDNGSVADDAFQILFDGLVLGSTAIGASNTLAVSNLLPGSHTLQIVVLIAPDDVGTYEIILSDGLTFEGGGTSRSSTLPRGGSASFGVIVPNR